MGRGSSHRDSAKEKFWREKIAKQPVSGLSIRAYCRRHRLQEARFYFWRRELLRRGVSAKPGPAFVPVRVIAEQPATAGQSNEGGCIEIVLGSGQCVRVRGVVDRRVLADVLSVLVGPSALATTEGRRC